MRTRIPVCCNPQRPMPYPFLVWAAALFLVPALGMAMGVVWIATFVGFAFAACMILLETVKVLARMTPGIRDFVPDDVSPQEVAAKRLEAEEHASRVAAEIEAEIEEVATALAPSRPQEAQALLVEAQEALKVAEGNVALAEESAKEQSGGWMAVCEARDQLREAAARVADAEMMTRATQAVHSANPNWKRIGAEQVPSQMLLRRFASSAFREPQLQRLPQLRTARQPILSPVILRKLIPRP